MFNNESVINQIKEGLNLVFSATNELLEDEDFSKNFDSFAGNIADYSKSIYDKFIDRGFSKEEAAQFTAALLNRPSGK